MRRERGSLVTDGRQTLHGSPPGLSPPGPQSCSAHPPPRIDVGDIHEGVVLLQWFVLVENLHLEEETEDTMTPVRFEAQAIWQ